MMTRKKNGHLATSDDQTEVHHCCCSSARMLFHRSDMLGLRLAPKQSFRMYFSNASKTSAELAST